MRRLALLVPICLLLSGCAGSGSGEGTPPSPSDGMGMNMTAPPPKIVFSEEPKTCPPATPTASVNKRFTVPEGYDQIVIEFHTSGEGQVNAAIRASEGNKEIWKNPDPNVNSAPAVCDSHSHSGNPILKAIEPGEYTGTIGLTGAVAVHFSVTARNTTANQTMNHEHMA